jgi:hypothetical protein
LSMMLLCVRDAACVLCVLCVRITLYALRAL